MNRHSSLTKKFLQITAVVAILVFTVGLALFALNGRYARFWADDYAYSAVALEGLIEGTREWYTYDGARLSSFWLVGVIDLFGMNAVRYLPGLLILLMTGSIGFFLHSLLKLARVKFSWVWIWLAAVLLVFFSMLLMPTRLETLYWRMGKLHYTVPIVLTVFILGLIFSWLARPSSGIKSVWRGTLILLAAFFSAANGEASGAWQSGVFLAAMVVFWFYNRQSKQRYTLVYFGLAMTGSLAAIMVMAVAPANEWRMEAMPPPASLQEFIYFTIRYSLDFVVDSIKTQPLPNLAFTLASLAVSLAVIPAAGLKHSWRKALPGILASLVISFGLIVFTVAPSVYAGVNYPAPRALMAARFSFLLGLMSAAFFSAFILRDLFARLSAEHWAAAAALVLVLVSLYTIRSYRIPLAEGRDLAVKADLWDKQDAQIRQAKLAGEMDVVVTEYDVVESLFSLVEDPNHWVNRSAAICYGVNSITALP